MSRWDEYYAEGGPVGYYPDLEKLTGIFIHDAQKMLELGCGAGAEIPYFVKHRGFGWHGVDVSAVAIEHLRKAYPDLADRAAVGDFTRVLPFGSDFDFIVDRASISHNPLPSVKCCMSLVREALKPGGFFIGCDWFSTKHSDAQRGREVSERTRTGYTSGQFRNVELVHFTDDAELIELFEGFQTVYVRERVTRLLGPGLLVNRPVRHASSNNDFREVDYVSAVYDIVARKP